LLGLILDVRPLQAHFRIPYNSLMIDSYPFPPKTTAIGLLAGAMGLPANGYAELFDGLKYGVIIEDPGKIVEETAAIYKNPTSPIYPLRKVLFIKPRYRMFFAGDDELIRRAYESLLEPKFALYLGDSESLLYPAKKTYVKLAEVEKGRESILRSVIPAEVWNAGGRFVVMKRNNLTPREYRVPVKFIYKRSTRRAVYRSVVAFAGGFVELANETNVLLFDGEPVSIL